jgi:hypothetical protein
MLDGIQWEVEGPPLLDRTLSKALMVPNIPNVPYKKAELQTARRGTFGTTRFPPSARLLPLPLQLSVTVEGTDRPTTTSSGMCMDGSRLLLYWPAASVGPTAARVLWSLTYSVSVCLAVTRRGNPAA